MNMHKYPLAALATLMVANTSHAAFIGELVLVEEDVSVFVGGSATTADVYNFVVTTTEGEGSITGFDFTSATEGGFSGDLLQGLTTFSTSSDLQNVGVVLGDSFFVSPVASPTAVQTLDTNTALESAFAFTSSPIDASGGVVAATLSVAAGGEAPVFEGGFALIDDQTFAIVPEPTSIALLGLGGLILTRRRRRG